MDKVSEQVDPHVPLKQQDKVGTRLGTCVVKHLNMSTITGATERPT